jgi:hypothetical protein
MIIDRYIYNINDRVDRVILISNKKNLKNKKVFRSSSSLNI